MQVDIGMLELITICFTIVCICYLSGCNRSRR